jgi:hypothetical protein
VKLTHLIRSLESILEGVPLAGLITLATLLGIILWLTILLSAPGKRTRQPESPDGPVKDRVPPYAPPTPHGLSEGKPVVSRPWYFTCGGEVAGPLTLAGLTRLRRDGVIRENTLLWQKGMPRWAPLGAVPDLADALDRDSRDMAP